MELQWPLILFTFFNCLAGGIFFMQGVLTLKGMGKKMQMTSLASALVALAVGGLAVFMHLEHWERIFNGFGHITSGITIELIVVVLFGIALVLYFLMMRRSEEGVAPKWCAVLAMVVGVCLPLFTGTSYLMEALPAWDTPLLPLYYMVNMVLLGSLASLLIAFAAKADDAEAVRGLLAKLAFGGAVAVAVVTIVYAAQIFCMGGSYTDAEFYFDPTLPDVAMTDVGGVTSAMLCGSLALPFWLLNVVMGCLVPGGVVLAGMKGKLKLEATNGMIAIGGALVCAIVGSFAWRCLLYVVAVHAMPFY